MVKGEIILGSTQVFIGILALGFAFYLAKRTGRL